MHVLQTRLMAGLDPAALDGAAGLRIAAQCFAPRAGTSLLPNGVTAGQYGDGTHVGQFTVDANGRLTQAASVTITGAAPTGSAGGDLAGAYPNPTIAPGNANPLIAGDVFAPRVPLLGMTGVAAGTYGDASHVPQVTVGPDGRVSKAVSVALAGAVPNVPGGRLTYTSGTPVTTVDVTFAATLYYTPYTSNLITLWDSSAWAPITFAETSYALSNVASAVTKAANFTSGSPILTGLPDTNSLVVGMAVQSSFTSSAFIQSIDSGTQITLNVNSSTTISSTFSGYVPQDVFGYNSAGVFTLEVVAWTNTLTRATAVTQQDGRYCKSGDKTRLYLGTFMPSTGGTGPNHANGEDSLNRRLLWNFYNRETKWMYRSLAGAHAYSSATGRAVNASPNSRVDFVLGLTIQSIRIDALNVYQSFSANSTADGYAFGFNIDISTSVLVGGRQITTYVPPASTIYFPATGYMQTYLAVGYHSIWAVEAADGSNPITFCAEGNPGMGGHWPC